MHLHIRLIHLGQSGRGVVLGFANGSGALGPTPLTRVSSRTMPLSTAEMSASPRSASRVSKGSGMAWE